MAGGFVSCTQLFTAAVAVENNCKARGLVCPGHVCVKGLQFQVGPGAHPASGTMGVMSLPRGQSGRGVALTTHPHIAPRLKKEYSYTSAPPLALRDLFLVVNFSCTGAVLSGTGALRRSLQHLPTAILLFHFSGILVPLFNCLLASFTLPEQAVTLLMAALLSFCVFGVSLLFILSNGGT